MTLNKEKFEEFKKQCAEAKARGHEHFMWGEYKVYVPYAEYLIEYVELVEGA